MMKKERPRKPASYITHQIAILIPYWKLDLKLEMCRSVAEVDLKMGALHEISVGKGFPNMFCCSKLELLLMEEIRLTTWDVKNFINTGGRLPTSTGESWISEPSTVCQFTQDLRIERSRNHKSCYHRTLKCSTGASLEVVEPDI